MENNDDISKSIESAKELKRNLETKRDLYYGIGITLIIFSILFFFMSDIIIKMICIFGFISGLLFVSTRKHYELQINDLESKIEVTVNYLYEKVESEKLLEISRKSQIWSKKFNVVGVKYRDKQDITNALKYISENTWSDRYQGMSNKEIEESFEKIYKFSNFSTSDFTLEPEPNNEFDRNAIKVMINNFCIGYIPRIEANQIINFINIMDKYSLKGTVSITGGPFKHYDYTSDKVVSQNSELGFSIYLEIHEK